MHILYIIGLTPPALLAAVVVISLLIAALMGRLADCWRFMLPLFLLSQSVTIVLLAWPPPLGFDLTGGSILVYQIERPTDGEPQDPLENTDDLVRALQRRIDPGYTGRATVRMSGNGEDVEIFIPGTQPEFEQHVQELVRPRGLLEFRIVADPYRHERLWALADQTTDFAVKEVRDDSGKVRARWVHAGTRIDPEPGDADADGDEGGDANAAVSTEHFPSGELAGMHHRGGDDGTIEVLIVEDAFQVSSEHVASVRPSVDGSLRPCLNFEMTPRGAALFGALTGNNLPDLTRESWAKLGIIIDGHLVSAPRINDRITDRGQITGQFTQEDVEFLAVVLSVGVLPVDVHPAPLSLTRVPAGKLLRWTCWGVYATVAALLLISAWAVVRYGVRGLVATLAAWVIVSLLVAGAIVLQTSMTFPMVATACGFVLLSAIALVIVCGPPEGQTDFSGRAPRGFLARAWPVVLASGLLLLVGIAVSTLGTGPARDVGVALRVSGMSGVISTLLCCWPLWSMRAKAPSSVTNVEDGVDVASGDEHGD